MATLLQLRPDECHLWSCDYDAVKSDASRFDSYFDTEEIARRDRFLFERDRRSFTISHALVRDVLSRYAEVPPRAWVFSANDHGRPEILEPAEHRGLRFNLSHTRGAAVVAVVQDYDVGVDIELRDRDASCVDLAERYFSAAETAELRGLPTEQQRSRFFDYWTLKEAYIKARGLGLAIPLDHFSFHLADGAAVGISFAPQLEDDPKTWQFVSWRADKRFQSAAAVQCGSSHEMRFLVRRIEPFGEAGEAVELPSAFRS